MSNKAKPTDFPGSPAWWMRHHAGAVRSTVPAVGRPQIPVERMLDAAIEIIDEAGTAGLGMRQLADRIGSGTATLYRHFAGKDDILAHAVDRVLGEIEIDAARMSASSWQQACMLGAEALYRVLERHPNVVPLLISQVPVGPNALAQREKAIAALLASGFSAGFAARTYSAVMHYVLGFASQSRASRGLQPTENMALRDFYRSLDQHDFPAIVAVADHLPEISNDDEFRFGLRLIVDGIARAGG